MGTWTPCKSISKRMPMDMEDVYYGDHAPYPNIVTLNGAHDDEDAVHHVMELCKGGELFAGSPCRATTPSVCRGSPHPHHRYEALLQSKPLAEQHVQA